MINLGLTTAEQSNLLKLLVSNRHIDIRVELLTLNHVYVSDVSTKLLGGQVAIDAQAERCSRTATIDLLDPTYTLRLDTNSPDDGSVHFTRMAKISYGVVSPDRKKSYYIPIFCGPIDKVERDEAVVTLTCVGKEVLMGSALWATKTYKPRTKKTDVIKNLLRYVGGETKYQIPDLAERLPKTLSFNYEYTPWQAAKKVANGMGYQLFYDGRGICVMRKRPSSIQYTFSERGALLTTPQPSYDTSSAINAVQFTGGIPKGAKTKVYWRVTAPASHPLSPTKLGRNGVPRYMPEYISDDSVRTVAGCKARATAHLTNVLIESTEVAFDSMPIPLAEEEDLCRVATDGWTSDFRMVKTSIPLLASGVSGVGYIKPTYRTRVTGGRGGGGKKIPVRKKTTTTKKRPRKRKKR